MHNSEKKKENCNCLYCKAIAEGATLEEATQKFQQWEAEKIAEYGWIIHHVSDDSNSPTKTNVHTHGLQEYLNHTDLQIVLPLPKDTIQFVLDSIVRRIKDGEKFGNGDVIEDVIANFSVKIIDATDGDRPVLRIIFPDQEGNCDSWDMKDPYLRQYGDIVDLPEINLPEKQKWTPFKK